MERLALTASAPQLALPAPKPESKPIYIALRAGKFHLPLEPSFKAIPMTIVLGAYWSQADADVAAATCKPGPGWIAPVQWTDIATPDAPATDGL